MSYCEKYDGSRAKLSGAPRHNRTRSAPFSQRTDSSVQKSLARWGRSSLIAPRTDPCGRVDARRRSTPVSMHSNGVKRLVAVELEHCLPEVTDRRRERERRLA